MLCAKIFVSSFASWSWFVLHQVLTILFNLKKTKLPRFSEALCSEVKGYQVDIRRFERARQRATMTTGIKIFTCAYALVSLESVCRAATWDGNSSEGDEFSQDADLSADSPKDAANSLS